MLTPYGRDNAVVLLLIGAAFMLLALAPIGNILSVMTIVFGLGCDRLHAQLLPRPGTPPEPRRLRATIR